MTFSDLKVHFFAVETFLTFTLIYDTFTCNRDFN